jgi:5-methylthioadenosine/S-adenosylhomocysteine deaminase
MKRHYAIMAIVFAYLLCGIPAHLAAAAKETVIKNVTVVDVEERKILENQQIVVNNERISFIGPQNMKVAKGGKKIDGTDLIAIPGFVNTHTHLWQHIAKGFYPSGNLQQWVRIYRYAHYFEPQELYLATLAAANQALLSGITTAADFASVNFGEFALEETIKALKDTGLHGCVVWWHPAVFLPSGLKEQEIERLKELGGKEIGIWMGPGPLSFYSLPAVYDGILTAQKMKLRITEHTMENVQEQRDFFENLNGYLEEYGSSLSPEDKDALEKIAAPGAPGNVDGMIQLYRFGQQILEIDEEEKKLSETERRQLQQLIESPSVSPVSLLEYLGALDRFVSIHSVWQTGQDMEIYRKLGVSVSHNPESNMYLSSGIAPILQYLEKGIPVSIGTDGAASNDGIDFFSAMRGTWNLQKLRFLDTAVTGEFSGWDVLCSATINGAMALGMDGDTGSLKVGKEADIILLSKKRLGISPAVKAGDVDNIVPLIIYSGGVRDVDTVLSDGRIVVRDGNLVEFREEDLAKELANISKTLVERYETGKVWREDVPLNIDSPAQTWVRFRSVRKKDTIQIKLENAGKSPIGVTAAMSGTTFGGTVSSMFQEEVLKRFPLQPPESYWDVRITLKSGESLVIERGANETSYTLIPPGSASITKKSVSSHQLMVYASGKH